MIEVVGRGPLPLRLALDTRLTDADVEWLNRHCELTDWSAGVRYANRLAPGTVDTSWVTTERVRWP